MNYNSYSNKYPYYNNMMNQNPNVMYTKDERGFLVPFVLGGITGGLLARPPYYGPGYPQPYYAPYPPYGFRPCC